MEPDRSDPGAGVDATETEPVELLRRWEDFGAAWRVVSHVSGTVTVALCRCDGGEEVMRISSSSPQLHAWLAGRVSSEQ
jgi:hypothetical protein